MLLSKSSSTTPPVWSMPVRVGLEVVRSVVSCGPSMPSRLPSATRNGVMDCWSSGGLGRHPAPLLQFSITPPLQSATVALRADSADRSGWPVTFIRMWQVYRGRAAGCQDCRAGSLALFDIYGVTGHPDGNL